MSLRGFQHARQCLHHSVLWLPRLLIICCSEQAPRSSNDAPEIAPLQKTFPGGALGSRNA